jgi:hypothetical protein
MVFGLDVRPMAGQPAAKGAKGAIVKRIQTIAIGF